MSLVVATLSIGACDFTQTTYGGSGEFLTLELLAQKLLVSSALVIRVTPSNATVVASDVTKITNQNTSFREVTGPVDLFPDVAGLGSISAGFLHFAPGGNGTYFSTPSTQQLLFPSVTVFAVLKSSSRGEVINVNPQDRLRQAFELSLDATNATAKFYSSSTASSQTSLALPSGTLIIGASFTQDTTAIDLSINGHLAPRPTITGTINPAFELSRVVNVGPSTSANSSDVKELLVFNRSLSKSEQGAMIKYLATTYSVAVTLDPSLAAVGGADPVDINFGPVQSMIESKCISCHGAWSGAKASFYVTQGLMTKGDALNSKLYYRLQGSGGASGPKNMPQSGSISSSETDQVKTWITNAP